MNPTTNLKKLCTTASAVLLALLLYAPVTHGYTSQTHKGDDNEHYIGESIVMYGYGRFGFGAAIHAYWLPDERLDGAVRMKCYDNYSYENNLNTKDIPHAWSRNIDFRDYAELAWGRDKLDDEDAAVLGWRHRESKLPMYGWKCDYGFVDIVLVGYDNVERHLGRMYPCGGDQADGSGKNKMSWGWITYISPDRKYGEMVSGCVRGAKNRVIPTDVTWGGFDKQMTSMPDAPRDWR